MHNPILIDTITITSNYNHVLMARSVYDLKSNLAVLYSALKDKYKEKDIIEYIEMLIIKPEYNIEQTEIKNFNVKEYIKDLIQLNKLSF